MERQIIVFLIVLLSWNAFAQKGVVLRVVDGDTLVLLVENHNQIKVRLSEIDAPERGQAFGSKAKDALIALCAEQPASLTNASLDRYGRTVARVSCNDVDANSAMVKSGFAWVYDEYVVDKTLYQTQDDARRRKAGLWADESPIAPWVYRRQKRRE